MSEWDQTLAGAADATLRGLAAGQRVFGRFVLDRMLGRGGMGVVWLAEDEQLGLGVALKFLPEAVSQDRMAVEDLREETLRSLRLTHHHIVRIYDFHRQGERAAIAMEYVDGDTLSNLRLGRPGRVFTTAELLPWVGQACEALEYAHSKARVVHRDLKPANLMVNGAGEVRVTDFGIARSLAESMTRVSGRSGTSGTLVYMSPQQLFGESPSPADDIYALAATIYELLTGKPPFYAGDISLQIRERVPPPMAERRAELGVDGEPIPAEWESVVAACLAKDPGRRPRTAGEVAAALEGRATRTTLSTQHSAPTVPGQATNVQGEGSGSGVPGAGVRVLSSDFGASRAGQEIENSVGMRFCWCPAGEFVMGSPPDEEGRYDNETQHRVVLTEGFWLGKYPVTQGEYERLMGGNPSQFTAAGSRAPVEGVSWDDAAAFCAQLTAMERGTGTLTDGWEYRLPTEAQWEYGCRAGTGSALNSGEALDPVYGWLGLGIGRCKNLDEVGWYAGNSEGTTHPVGQKAANAWGLHDMHGNVWEWCSDWWGKYPSGTATNPTGPSSGSFRVRRGGSWFSNARLCRSADRDRLGPSYRYYILGFRVAAVPRR